MSRMYDMIRARLMSRARLHESYQAIFGSPDGERVLRHILKVGCVTSSTFVAGDPCQTAHNEGKRNLALSILRFVCKDHNKLMAEIERGIQNDDT